MSGPPGLPVAHTPEQKPLTLRVYLLNARARDIVESGAHLPPQQLRRARESDNRYHKERANLRTVGLPSVLHRKLTAGR